MDWGIKGAVEVSSNWTGSKYCSHVDASTLQHVTASSPLDFDDASSMELEKVADQF
jgi:hypothetical protein